MKRNRILIFSSGTLITVLFLILVSFKPQEKDSSGDYAIMRVYESGNANLSKILISYDNYRHVEIDLWAFGNKYVDEWFDNADTIASRITWFDKQGYEIISSNSAGTLNSMNDFQLTTYIFEKKR